MNLYWGCSRGREGEGGGREGERERDIEGERGRHRQACREIEGGRQRHGVWGSLEDSLHHPEYH